MDDVEEFTPKDLEVLPNKMVYDILQYGITHDSLHKELNGDQSLGVSKNSKNYNPKNRKFKKEALCSMNRVASLFVLYITTIAESIAKSNKRSTVFDRDILQALRECMFWEVESQITESQNPDSNASSKAEQNSNMENDVEMDADDNLENEADDDYEPDDLYMDELEDEEEPEDAEDFNEDSNDVPEEDEPQDVEQELDNDNLEPDHENKEKPSDNMDEDENKAV